MLTALRQLSYRPGVIKLARVLGLRELGRKAYYRWACPRNGILRVQVAGVSAQFEVHTPEELRMLDKAEHGYWEQDVLEALTTTLRPGDVVYDIGGNIGLYTVLMAKCVGPSGQIISFEPQRQCYTHLQANIRLNNLENIRAFRLALGDSSGQETLYTSSDLLFSNLVRPRGGNGGGETVQLATGDAVRCTEGLPVPRLVKIDVEGYEGAVLRGLKETLAHPTCELVCCEVHPTLLPSRDTAEGVLELLQSLGFTQIERFPGPTVEFHVIARKSHTFDAQASPDS